MLKRNSDTRGLSTLLSTVALKELGLIKCVLKYGGGGIGGGTSAGTTLAEDDDEGILVDGAAVVSTLLSFDVNVDMLGRLKWLQCTTNDVKTGESTPGAYICNGPLTQSTSREKRQSNHQRSQPMRPYLIVTVFCCKYALKE